MDLSLIFAHVIGDRCLYFVKNPSKRPFCRLSSEDTEAMGSETAWTSAIAAAWVFLSLLQPPEGTSERLSQSGGSGAQITLLSLPAPG